MNPDTYLTPGQFSTADPLASAAPKQVDTSLTKAASTTTPTISPYTAPTPTPATSPAQPAPVQEPAPPQPSAEETKLGDAQKELDQVNADFDAEANNTINTITKIQNGSIPLDSGQVAQVEALKQQMTDLIDKQKLSNTSASGIANVRGYQTGAAEYDPSFQAKTIGSIVSTGLKRVAALDVEMAGAVSQLTQAFKDKNIMVAKEKWEIYKEKEAKRAEALQKTVDDTQKAIDEAHKMQREATRDTEITKLFKSGVTSTTELLQRLNASGGDYTLKEIDDAMKIVNPPPDLAGLSADYRTFEALKKAGDSSVKNMNWLQYQRAVTNATTKVSSSGGLGGGGGGKVSPITQSVIANPSLFDDLTPTVRGQVIAELQAAGYSTTNLGTKGLDNSAIETMAQTQGALSSLNDLKQKINDNLSLIGPITGLAVYNPYSKARQVQADIDRVKQTVGKALEGGVLRKEDEEKYKKILATITDTPETALYKIDSLIGYIQRDIEKYKELQSSAGRSIDVNAPLIKNGTEVPVTDLRTKYQY